VKVHFRTDAPAAGEKLQSVAMTSTDTPATRLATRLAFLVAGFGMACWAPLVPFAKARLGVDDGVLGLLLLCIGAGSVGSMVLTGPACSHYGSRPVVGLSGLAATLLLPALAFASTPLTLGLALLLFGAAIGSLDVAMNVHAVEVERAAPRPLMSGFHGMYSVGGFAGSGFMTGMLSLHVAPLAGACLGAILMLAVMATTWPRLLRALPGGARGPLFAVPHGLIMILAALAGVTFLSEGALLDWSALLVTGAGLVPEAQGGLGYMLFSIAMTAGRFGGDHVVARIGDRATLVWGGLANIAGYLVLLLAPAAPAAMTGFLLIGLGASNLVPVLFRRAGTQSVMPPALAIAAITMVGYAGILVGPAIIGFVAKGVGLHATFWGLAAFLCVVPASAGLVAPAKRREQGSVR
jgi:predicted MFS family arabinose efflux permease